MTKFGMHLRMHPTTPRPGKTLRQRAEPAKAGERMLAWLAWTGQLLRDQANASIEDVASMAQVSSRIIERFEKGENWPRELEVILAAYANVARLDDSLTPWDVAVDLWRKHGTIPIAVGRRDEQAREQADQKEIVSRVAEQVRRTLATDRAAPVQRSTAKKKTRATG